MKQKIAMLIMIALVGICSFSISAKAEETDDSLFEQGYELMQKEDYQSAANIYKKLYDKYEQMDAVSQKEHVNTYYNLGICYQNLGRLYQSNEVFEKAILMQVSDEERSFCCYELSSNYNDLGNYSIAKDYAKRGLKNKVNMYAYNLYLEYGDALLGMKRYENAEQFYLMAGEYNPDYKVQVEDKLANIAVEKKDYASAVEHYSNIVTLNENYKEPAIKKIVELSAKISKKNLEKDVQKYLVKELGYSDQSIADFLNDRKYYKEAIEYYDKVLQKNESSVEAVYWKGNALEQIGEYQSAIDLFKYAYELDSEYKTSIENIIICYRELGQFEKASEYCDFMFKKSSKDPVAIFYKYYNDNALQDKASADKIINSVEAENNMPYYIHNAFLESLPTVTEKDIISAYSHMDEFPTEEYQQALYIMDHIDLGHFSSDSLQNYENYMKRMVEEFTFDSYLLSEYARILSLNGKYKEALLEYEKAKSREAYRTEEILELEMQLYIKMHQPEKALELVKEARESFPLNDYFKSFEGMMLYTYFGQPEDAIVIFSGLLETEPESTYYLSELMRSYDVLKDYSSVEAFADKILAADKNNLYAKAYKAKALQKLKKEGADVIVADIDKKKYSPCDADIIYADSILGRNEAVLERLKQYLTEHPSQNTIESISIDYDMQQSFYNEEIATIMGVETLKRRILPEELQNPIVTLAIMALGLVFLLSGVISLIFRRNRSIKKMQQII